MRPLSEDILGTLIAMPCGVLLAAAMVMSCWLISRAEGWLEAPTKEEIVDEWTTDDSTP